MWTRIFIGTSARTSWKTSLLTIADPELVLASRDYAERVAIQVLEYLLDLDHFRGVGRLFVP